MGDIHESHSAENDVIRPETSEKVWHNCNALDIPTRICCPPLSENLSLVDIPMLNCAYGSAVAKLKR